VETYPGVRWEGNAAEEEIGGEVGAPAVSSGGGGAAVREEERGEVRKMRELEGILYRAKRGAEGVRLRRWAARSVVAINGGSVRWRRVGEGEGVRWSSGRRRIEDPARWGGEGAWEAGEAAPGCGSRRRRGEEGGAVAGGRGRPRQVGPTCRRLREREEVGGGPCGPKTDVGRG
jgi:hypothetical protein